MKKLITILLAFILYSNCAFALHDCFNFESNLEVLFKTSDVVIIGQLIEENSETQSVFYDNKEFSSGFCDIKKEHQYIQSSTYRIDQVLKGNISDSFIRIFDFRVLTDTKENDFFLYHEFHQELDAVLNKKCIQFLFYHDNKLFHLHNYREVLPVYEILNSDDNEDSVALVDQIIQCNIRKYPDDQTFQYSAFYYPSYIQHYKNIVDRKAIFYDDYNYMMKQNQPNYKKNAKKLLKMFNDFIFSDARQYLDKELNPALRKFVNSKLILTGGGDKSGAIYFVYNKDLKWNKEQHLVPQKYNNIDKEYLYFQLYPRSENPLIISDTEIYFPIKYETKNFVIEGTVLSEYKELEEIIKSKIILLYQQLKKYDE